MSPLILSAMTVASLSVTEELIYSVNLGFAELETLTGSRGSKPRDDGGYYRAKQCDCCPPVFPPKSLYLQPKAQPKQCEAYCQTFDNAE